MSPFRYSKTSTISDGNGFFALEDKSGKHLSVWVDKKGYYSSKSNLNSFFYSGENEVFTPNANNPVLFHVRKKGSPEPLMRLASAMIGPRQYRLDTIGTPTDISFFTGKRTAQGQFRVEYSMEVPEDSKQQQFIWHCKITVPGGGLQAITDEFPLTAPEHGYQETIEIDSNTDAWLDRLEQNYYIYLPGEKYGRVKFSLNCSANPFFGVEVLINPSGSKNLEYDKYLPGNIMVDQSAP